MSWRRWLNGLFFLLGGGGLVWIVWTIGPDEIGRGLSRAGGGFAAACAIHLVAILLDAITLRACAGAPGRDVPYLVFARASLAGHGINQATPLGKLGEITKVTVMAEQLPVERATSALIVQNFVMFVINCALIASGAVVAWAFFEVDSTLMTGWWIVGAVFFVLGAAALLLMWRGIGDLPIRIAGWLGVSGDRADRWAARWREIEHGWHDVAADRRYMRLAFASSATSRLVDFAEIAAILYALDIGPLAATAVVAVAGDQVVFWTTSFVPLQAGTAEGGAYLLFEGIGKAGAAGVLLELVRKARRLVFIAVAVILVGWRSLMPRARLGG
jgi:hypothetical protein